MLEVVLLLLQKLCDFFFQKCEFEDDDFQIQQRLIYCSKASKAERNAGCEKLDNDKKVGGNYSQSPTCKTCGKTLNGTNDHSKCSGEVFYKEMDTKMSNNHPTVKPIALMEYLVKLISKEEAKKLGEELNKTEYGQYIIRRASQWK